MQVENKYDTAFNKHTTYFIPQSASLTCRQLLTASLSRQTWQKNNSAFNCLKTFSKTTSSDITFPLKDILVVKFVEWCHSNKKLKASTIRSYLSSIATAHKMQHMNPSACSCFQSTQMLRGIENLEFYENICKKTRKVMTLPLLKIAGNEISKTNWCEDSKQVAWAVLTTAFFGSFRLGEILCPTENSYNPKEHLLWKDVLFREDNSILIKIKIPKSRNAQGEFIDIFPFKGHKCCPVAALKKLKKLRPNCPDKPLFTFKNGKCVTAAFINEKLPILLSSSMGSASKEYLGHSLRPALASALANDPDTANDQDVKKWGRWNSSSYQLYTRLKLEQKKQLYKKITNVLNKQ